MCGLFEKWRSAFRHDFVIFYSDVTADKTSLAHSSVMLQQGPNVQPEYELQCQLKVQRAIKVTIVDQR